jgi:hypothetical protein
MSIWLWVLIYPLFFFLKMWYYQVLRPSGSFWDSALWARIPLTPKTYPMRDKINTSRPVIDWIIFGVLYVFMGFMGIAADLIVHFVYVYDRDRFGW